MVTYGDQILDRPLPALADQTRRALSMLSRFVDRDKLLRVSELAQPFAIVACRRPETSRRAVGRRAGFAAGEERGEDRAASLACLLTGKPDGAGDGMAHRYRACWSDNIDRLPLSWRTTNGPPVIEPPPPSPQGPSLTFKRRINASPEKGLRGVGPIQRR